MKRAGARVTGRSRHSGRGRNSEPRGPCYKSVYPTASALWRLKTFSCGPDRGWGDKTRTRIRVGAMGNYLRNPTGWRRSVRGEGGMCPWVWPLGDPRHVLEMLLAVTARGWGAPGYLVRQCTGQPSTTKNLAARRHQRRGHGRGRSGARGGSEGSIFLRSYGYVSGSSQDRKLGHSGWTGRGTQGV